MRVINVIKTTYYIIHASCLLPSHAGIGSCTHKFIMMYASDTVLPCYSSVSHAWCILRDADSRPRAAVGTTALKNTIMLLLPYLSLNSEDVSFCIPHWTNVIPPGEIRGHKFTGMVPGTSIPVPVIKTIYQVSDIKQIKASPFLLRVQHAHGWGVANPWQGTQGTGSHLRPDQVNLHAWCTLYYDRCQIVS